MTAVDTRPPSKIGSASITYVRKNFSTFFDEVRTAFLSWPVAIANPDLVRIVRGARTVIYLGSNLDGTACGGQDLWAHFASRRVLAHVPDRKNTLIVYGREGAERELLPEEAGAFDIQKIHLFSDAYGVT